MTQIAHDAAPSAPKKLKKLTEAIKLIPSLIEGFRWNNEEKYRTASEAIAAAIEDTYPALAKKVRNSFPGRMKPVQMLPSDLLSMEEVQHGFEAVILPDSLTGECRSIIMEHHRQEDLRAYDLEPRHKVLLYGPPGNGKTMLAEALAHELDVVLLRVKYGGLLESYMGASGKNIDRIFEYAKTAPCVLFLDEFDGVGMDRNGGNDVGEIRRITNQLLIAIDHLPSTCVLVAATNCPELVDGALKRRFDFAFEIPAPTRELMLRCAERQLAPELTPGHDVSDLAERVVSLRLVNLSDVVNVCQRIRRDLVLNEGKGVEGLLKCPAV